MASVGDTKTGVRTADPWAPLKKPKRFTLIAGPCVIESEALCLEIAQTLQKICRRLGILYIFKASYDKANRTSAKSFRGPGLNEGLEVLGAVREAVGAPVLTDVHSEKQ